MLYLATRPLALLEAGLNPLAYSGRGILPSFVAKFGRDAYGLRVGASAKFGKFAFAHTRQCVQRKVDAVILACQRCQSQRVGPNPPSSSKPTLPLPAKNSVDKWMTRTFNRYFGTMMGADGKIIDAPTDPQRRAVKALVNEVAKNAGIKPYQVQSLLWFYEQRLSTEMGVRSPS